MISDGCLAHKTAVALAALSQYIRFLISSTSAADHHLLSINYLVEPYRLPQESTVPVTSLSVDRAPIRLGNIGQHRSNQQLVVRMKESRNRPVGGHPDRAYDDEIDIAGEKKIPADKTIALKDDKDKRKFVRSGESQPDGDYDENTEVELDKDDVKFVQSRDTEMEDEDQQDAAITGVGLLRRVVNPALLIGQGRSHGDIATVRVIFKSHWFLVVFAVFLLVFWFRCIRCFRCGFLLRLCLRT